MLTLNEIHDLISECELVPSKDPTRRILQVCEAMLSHIAKLEAPGAKPKPANNTRKLFHVQDADRGMWVVADSWQHALDQWAVLVARENDEDMFEMEPPDGVQYVCDSNDLICPCDASLEKEIARLTQLVSDMDVEQQRLRNRIRVQQEIPSEPDSPYHALEVGLCLYTRDGRRMGNGIITGIDRAADTYIIETDFGNLTTFSEAEVRAYWYTADASGNPTIESVDAWRAERSACRTVAEGPEVPDDDIPL